MLMRNYFSKLGTQVPWRTSQSRGATLALPLRYLSALLILLTLSIGQSWAADPDLAVGATAQTSSTFLGEYSTPGITLSSSASYSSGAVQIGNTASAYDANYFEVLSSSAEIEKVSFLISGNGSNKSIQAPVFAWATTATSNTADTYVLLDAVTVTANSYAAAQWFEYDLSGANVKCARIYRTTKNISSTSPAYTGSSTALGSGQTIKIYGIKVWLKASSTKHTVTYDLNGGTGTTPTQADVAEGAKFTLHDGTTGIIPVSGKEFAGWNDGTSTFAGGAEYTMGTSNVTLTAQWQDPAPKYAVTYVLNGPSGDAPTQASVAAGTSITLASAPTWAGHAFDGWLCSADAAVKAAGSSYTMTAENTTFTAQWHEVDCKIYSLTGGIGSAEVTAGTATVSADALVLSNTNARIKLTPASGETFKAGDVITISGFTGNASKKFGVYVKNASGTNIATAEVANVGEFIASAALSADAEYVELARKEGTTMTLLTCEVHRACAEGAAAGLSFAEAEVAKTEGDAPFTNALTNANDLVFAGYGSSDKTVATVAANGEVTIVGPGSATITAYSAVQTKAGTLYAAGNATFALTVAELPKYTVTYDLNGGSGTVTEVDHKAGEKFNLHDGVTDITAPSSKTFINWKDQDNAEFAGGAQYTMPAKNVTLTAQWAGDVYTVKFMDGETLLDSKLVEVGQNPTDIEHPTKPLYTFAAWQKDAVDIALDDASWASVAKDAVITLTARWAKAYASNADFEAYIIANNSEKDDVDKAEAYVKSLNYALSTKTGTTFDANTGSNNGAYAGLKIKNSGTVLSWNVVAGKVVELKAGVMVANGSLAINGGTPATIDGGTTGTGDNFKVHTFYSAAEALYEFTTSNGSAEVIKAITMRDPYTVSFDANGGDPVAPLSGTPSVTLPSAMNGTQNFAGWYDALDNFIGNAGATYTPSANIELVAKWEALSTVNTLSDLKVDGVTIDGFDQDVHTYYIELPYGTDVANLPKITEATPTNANASVTIYPAAGPEWTDDFGGCYRQQANVTPQDPTAAVGYNDIRITIAPKDGVSIIKVTAVSGAKGAVTGLYAGDGAVSLSSSNKMDNGKYIGFIFDGTTLQAGDRINVHTTTAANTGGSHIIFYDNMTDKNELFDTEEIGGAGDNIFTINAAMVGHASAYVYRSNADAAHQWNGYVDFIEVTRAINPVLTAITIDGRAGEIDEVNKTVTVSFPYESDLASLDVQPTIVWNGAGSAAPLAAWAEGANTYRITDKDGDYTDYTVTLTRDDLKYAVTFNTHGGSAVEPQNVKDGESPVLPTEPTKEDYLFQGWAETDGGAIVDVTSFTISAAKEFHAVWAPDGAIKLLDGSTVNHTNFITGVTATTVNFDDADHNCVIFAGTVSGVNGVKDLDRVIAYNATTTQTRIQLSLHNTSTNSRQVYVKGVVEGSTDVVDIASITLGNQETVTTSYYNFDNASNRTIYIIVPNSAGNVCFLQVKVIETGTALPMAGQAGYELNLNKGRIFGRAPSAISNFEGLHVESLGADYQPTSSTVGRFYLGKSISFDVASPVTLSITANDAKTYYVTKDAAGTDNETSKKGVSEFELTAGTWFITAGLEDMQFTNIAFMLPKCAEPAFNALANSDVCAGDPYVALNGTATVADAGVPTYQWYKEDNTPIDGATNAEYTPTEDGKYYVIAVNHLDGFSDNEKKSELVSVASVASTVINEAPKNVRKDAGEAATLTVDASGKNLHYAWKESDAIDGTYTDVAGADDAASLDVTVPIGVKFYKVVITSDCGEAIEAIAKVEEWVELTQQDVTATTFWDFSKNGVSTNTTIPVTEEEPVKLLANIPGVNNNELFRSDNIVAGSGKLTTGYIQTQKLSFHATVPGYITVSFSNTGNKENYRYLVVNGVETSAGSKNGTVISYSCAVPAGDVELTVTEADGGKMFNFRSLKFEKMDYFREIRPGYYGTICLEHGGKMYGAALYEVAYFDGADKIFFDEIVDGTMVPGMPYIFLPEGGSTALAVAYSEETPSAVALSKNGLHGSYTQVELTPDAGNYILLNNQYLFVNSTNVFVGANRAYIRLGEIGTTPYAPAPGRRRIAMGVQNSQVATGMENLNAGEAPMKVMIDGQLFILRGENMFDATGRLVK